MSWFNASSEWTPQPDYRYDSQIGQKLMRLEAADNTFQGYGPNMKIYSPLNMNDVSWERLVAMKFGRLQPNISLGLEMRAYDATNTKVLAVSVARDLGNNLKTNIRSEITHVVTGTETGGFNARTVDWTHDMIMYVKVWQNLTQLEIYDDKTNELIHWQTLVISGQSESVGNTGDLHVACGRLGTGSGVAVELHYLNVGTMGDNVRVIDTVGSDGSYALGLMNQLITAWRGQPVISVAWIETSNTRMSSGAFNHTNVEWQDVRKSVYHRGKTTYLRFHIENMKGVWSLTDSVTTNTLISTALSKSKLQGWNSIVILPPRTGLSSYDQVMYNWLETALRAQQLPYLPKRIPLRYENNRDPNAVDYVYGTYVYAVSARLNPTSIAVLTTLIASIVAQGEPGIDVLTDVVESTAATTTDFPTGYKVPTGQDTSGWLKHYRRVPQQLVVGSGNETSGEFVLHSGVSGTIPSTRRFTDAISFHHEYKTGPTNHALVVKSPQEFRVEIDGVSKFKVDSTGAGLSQISGEIAYSSTSQSTSNSTGALTLAGGLGVKKNIWMDGQLRSRGYKDPATVPIDVVETSGNVTDAGHWFEGGAYIAKKLRVDGLATAKAGLTVSGGPIDASTVNLAVNTIELKANSGSTTPMTTTGSGFAMSGKTSVDGVGFTAGTQVTEGSSMKMNSSAGVTRKGFYYINLPDAKAPDTPNNNIPLIGGYLSRSPVFNIGTTPKSYIFQISDRTYDGGTYAATLPLEPICVFNTAGTLKDPFDVSSQSSPGVVSLGGVTARKDLSCQGGLYVGGADASEVTTVPNKIMSRNDPDGAVLQLQDRTSTSPSGAKIQFNRTSTNFNTNMVVGYFGVQQTSPTTEILTWYSPDAQPCDKRILGGYTDATQGVLVSKTGRTQVGNLDNVNNFDPGSGTAGTTVRGGLIIQGACSVAGPQLNCAGNYRRVILFIQNAASTVGVTYNVTMLAASVAIERHGTPAAEATPDTMPNAAAVRSAINALFAGTASGLIPYLNWHFAIRNATSGSLWIDLGGGPGNKARLEIGQVGFVNVFLYMDTEIHYQWMSLPAIA